MSNECLGCGSESVKITLDLGEQPPSNRFLATTTESCETHRLLFGYCTVCGLAQLCDPMPISMVRARFEWITYNEPEGHLDDLVGCLSAYVGGANGTSIIGVTYKDDTTLARFRRAGVDSIYRLDQLRDLDIQDPLASLETIQSALTLERADEIVSRRGQADIVLVRHILEHAHQPQAFVEACQRLCKPDGWMVFEVPDSRKVLGGGDHCFVWEEHIVYFTPTTLAKFFGKAGYREVELLNYPYPMEDSLVAVIRNRRQHTDEPLQGEPGQEIERLERFSNSFAGRRARMQKYLQALHVEGKNVALFGAGHLAAKFINFYGLSPFLSTVIDDNPNKRKCLMPGSRLPIAGSQSLENGEVDLCLLTLNPESEQKVLKAKKDYIAGGGRFRSIFTASPTSIDRDL